VPNCGEIANLWLPPVCAGRPRPELYQLPLLGKILLIRGCLELRAEPGAGICQFGHIEVLPSLGIQLALSVAQALLLGKVAHLNVT